MGSTYYPDDISGEAVCHIEGCLGKGPCPRCGAVNYALMGYYGALARWGKVWGLTEEETELRFGEHWDMKMREKETR